MSETEQEPPPEVQQPDRLIDLRDRPSVDDLLGVGSYRPATTEAIEDLEAAQAVTTSIMLSLGVLARESRLAYAIKQDVPGTFWPQSQRTLMELLKAVRDAGWEANVAPPDETDDLGPSPFLAVYNAFYDYSGSNDHQAFTGHIDAFVELQEKFVNDPRRVVFDDYANVLRPFTVFVRNASEVFFIQRFGKPYLEGEVVIPDTMVHHGLLREFTDVAYWRHSTNELLNDRLRSTGTDTIGRMGVIAMHEQLMAMDIADDEQETRQTSPDNASSR